jgi:hypothetical protein
MIRTLDDRVRAVRRLLEAARTVHADRARFVAAIARSSGLSPEGVELGFGSLETSASAEDLRALIASAGDARHVHVILSANVFVAPLRAIAMARAAASRVTVHPSSRDPTLAVALIEAADDPAITLASGRDVATVGADRIDVYGRDETIAAVRAGAGRRVEVRGHGTGLGLAFISSAPGPRSGAGARAATAAAAEALAADVVPFDQRGCLSPRVVLVEDPAGAGSWRSDEGAGEGSGAGADDAGVALAAALHERLGAWGLRVPRGALGEDERSAAARWRDALAFAGQVWAGADHAVALVPGQHAGTLALAVPPPGRHLLVVPVRSVEAARAAIAPIAPFVVTVGSSDAARAAEIAPAHARLAPLGGMQRPPLDGPVDRRSP